jgi:hypothetical protein
MKTLSLYIDRWYIAAAVSSDNIPRRMELPNREDRIWLYFYEDINNDRIIYGKSYQQHYLDKEVHYHGDIFSRIVKEDETFKRFGKDVNLKEIFKASEIFEHLRKDFLENEEIQTYVSFSVDVTYAAQKVFLDILGDNGFKVKESVARISHLALELSSKKGYLKNAKNILVVIACNENLRYVVYKQAKDVFVRQTNEGVLRGYGTDLRGRALLEQIVWQINNSSKFLKKEEEEFEIIRLSQNLERWLLQLDNTKYGRPVVYNDITFSRAPHNKQSATIIKNVIEDRTKAIVNVVVDNIIQYVKENKIISSDISHILFIGNSFKNTMFKDALLQRYAVNNDNIIIYQDKDLPEIVSIYNQMDLSQFDSIRTDYENLSAEQLEQIKIAEEERKERERATRKQEEIDQANAAVREAEKKFNAALQEAENYEKKGDYSGMIDLLNIALTIKPENAEAKQLLDEANRKLSEVKVKNEQYNKAIRAAQDAFTEQRWQDAYSKSETALELRPDSLEAKRIKTDSQRKIKLTESVKEFLLRADTFIGQKLYQEAMEELEKAKLADASNKDISLRISKIKSIQLKHKNDVDTLIQQLTEAKGKKEFEKAIDLCNSLIDIDFTNQRKWSELIVSLKADWNKIKQDEELFANLKQQINDSYFNEEWERLVGLCDRALAIKHDEDIFKTRQKANAKVQTVLERKVFDDAVSQIKSLIADKMWDKAEMMAKELRKKYPEQNDVVKNLLSVIFEAQETWAMRREDKNSTTRPVVKGFRPEKPKDKNPISPNEFDFDFPKKEQKDTSVKRIGNDDFFDLGKNTIQANTIKEKVEIITNKDFDF